MKRGGIAQHYPAARAKPRKLLVIPFLLFFAAGCLPAQDAGGETTVYVTNSGERYHREACGSLRRSKIAVPLGDAVKSGYQPCAVCRPPALAAAELAGAAAGEDAELYRVNIRSPRDSAGADISRMVPAEVMGHIDGDTVRVRITSPPAGLKVVETIRLIGVDTPETVHPRRPVEAFGKEASEFTRTRLLNQPVYLAFDWDLRDRYGRLLAYIYTAGGRCFNADLISEGYGHAYTRFPFQFMDEFRLLEQKARGEGRGLWGDRR